ncbi:MAG TPA: monovalent cation/H(+) antiporter subunit G [Alphaproteobacteria bacterium]|jgi:multicomponent Na+:H+ antiporter subunit G|nr:monovalent cation/H(+) antiporter subunit G [Alphaproteobacteria bacterium]MDP6271432.1 monovalent cation/H(+) antiporter subunit G [Alphaproteobacteria bacterium]MDP7428425.1 monovalent cation/H(+) antiporter subunit G [Alphaproteobacteria bacterium]HJM48940.1 monovalent cation/H(+) antiporter subunit G [Alphaproteobacteria bacterium]|tara:strand:- start:142 stop:483 length:342 start_codon:yes stop_codon:yes gene_type:complete
MSAFWIEFLSDAMLALGGLLAVISGLGIVRLPDFYSRLHAAGIGDTLALWLILTGLMLKSGLTLVTVKLLFIVFFLVFTSPTSTHALVKAAYRKGVMPWMRQPAGDDGGEPPS